MAHMGNATVHVNATVSFLSPTAYTVTAYDPRGLLAAVYHAGHDRCLRQLCLFPAVLTDQSLFADFSFRQYTFHHLACTHLHSAQCQQLTFLQQQSANRIVIDSRMFHVSFLSMALSFVASI